MLFRSTQLARSLQRKLGQAYRQLREFDRAIEIHESALVEAREQNRLDDVASTLFNLGGIAIGQRRFNQAKAFCLEALRIYQAQDDRYSQANTYQQLGNIAEAMREYEEARVNYQQALQIKVEFNDRYSQAMTYHNLGTVSAALREYEEAR